MVEVQQSLLYTLIDSKMVSDVAFLLGFLRHAILFDQPELAGVKFREEDVALELIVNFGQVYTGTVGTVKQLTIELSSSNHKHLVHLPSIDERLQNLHSIWKAGRHVVSLWNLGQRLAHHNVYPVAQWPELRRQGLPREASHDDGVLLSRCRVFRESREVGHFFLEPPRQGLLEADPPVTAHSDDGEARHRVLCAARTHRIRRTWAPVENGAL